MRRSFPAVLLILTTLPLPAFAAPPPSSGAFDETVVDGLLRPVRIRRDVHDIPHIFAANDRDALFALGYSHARDRLFQMDLLRRTFSGTLGELVGADVLEQDVQLRTLGLRRAAEASLPALSTATRAWLTAYARGVNSYIRNPANPLPPEYAVLELSRASIEPWDPVDSIVIAKGLAFNLSFDVGDIDLTTALLAFQTVGTVAGFDGEALFSEDLYRSAPFDPTVSIPGFLSDAGTAGAKGPVCSATKASHLSPRTAGLARSFRDRARQIPLLRDALERRETGRGSNWWVASGEVTATGRPLLANDPHLSLDTPSIFYEAQLRVSGGERPAMNAFGVTFAGIPGIVLGCNPRICWGATTNPMDVTDVYQERLVIDPALGLPTHTVFDGRREPLVAIPQTFFVNRLDGTPDNPVNAGVGPLEGGVTLIVPRRNNGPIVAVDLSDPANPIALSVQYTGWSPTRELDAFRIWNRAGSLTDFRDGLQYFDVGSQNWAYADVDGNIAYFTSAEMPLREDLQNLSRPDGAPPFFIRDGTHTLRNEWLPVSARREPGQAIPYAILPFREMPQVVNPERGWIANANNDPVGTSVDNNPLNQLRPGGRGIYYLGPGYDGGFRIGRIERLLEAELERDGSFSREDFERFQANNQMLDAEVLTPHLLAAFYRARATGASGLLAGLAANPRVAEAIGRLRTWDYSTPTGIREGYDPGDDPANLPEPTAREVTNSIAATIYSVWRGQVVQRVIDQTLESVGLEDFAPGGDRAMSALRHLLEAFPANQGRGASGLQFFVVPGTSGPAEARDVILLASLQSALELLASDAFAPAFANSIDQNDYRWGRLHRIVFDHPLGEPFNIPQGNGFTHLAPDLPGIARSGGFEVVDASSHSARADGVNEFMFGSGPARRFIGEMKTDGPVAEEVIPGGQSGLPSSPFRADQLLLWLTNRYHPWPYRPADVTDATRTQEVLEPRR